MKNAIILCSGGLDSVVTAYYVKKKLSYKKLIILFFDYSQRTLKQERKYSKLCAKDLNAEFEEIRLKWLGKISNSLLNKKNKLNKVAKKQLKDTKKESDKFYVPFRNGIFLVYAISLAEALYNKDNSIYDIFVGFKCEGKESYPDTSKLFVDKLNNLSKISTNGKFKINAPLINKDKDEIVLLGKKLNVNFKKTYSCYNGDKFQCGYCLACKLRQEGFYWANVKDSTKYSII